MGINFFDNEPCHFLIPRSQVTMVREDGSFGRLMLIADAMGEDYINDCSLALIILLLLVPPAGPNTPFPVESTTVFCAASPEIKFEICFESSSAAMSRDWSTGSRQQQSSIVASRSTFSLNQSQNILRTLQSALNLESPCKILRNLLRLRPLKPLQWPSRETPITKPLP